MFNPRPKLVLAADGSYFLIVAVQVPTTCYRALGIKPGLPAGVVGIPEIDYYTFEIVHDANVFCGQIVHDVTATYSNIRLGSGKSAVGVIVTVDGVVKGGAVVRPPANHRSTLPRILGLAGKAASQGILLPDSVSATAYGGIVGPAVLEVSCLVVTPTGGFTAELRPMKPQGINPRILLLELIVHPPTGPATDMVSIVSAHYTEKPFQFQYTEASVVYGTTVVTVPIIVVLGLGLQNFKQQAGVKSFLDALAK